VLLLLGHVLGDFYFQPKTMADKKDNSWLWLAGHSVIYALCVAAVLLTGAYYSLNLLFVFLATSISHLIVDIIKRFVKWKKFIIDQLVHLAFLGASWMIWGKVIQSRPFVLVTFDYMQKSIVLVVLGLLCVLRPVALLIEHGDIWDFSKGKTPPNESQKGAGRMIGYLERTIVFFLLLNGQYAAIAFVMTAKSVARFPEISSNGEGRTQAEYYIIGTLLSMTSVFAITFLLGLQKA